MRWPGSDVCEDRPLLAQTGPVGGGKIHGNLLGRVPSGGPFHSPLQGGDESHALLGAEISSIIVAERGVKDPSLSEGDGHEHGFNFS